MYYIYSLQLISNNRMKFVLPVALFDVLTRNVTTSPASWSMSLASGLVQSLRDLLFTARSASPIFNVPDRWAIEPGIISEIHTCPLPSSINQCYEISYSYFCENINVHNVIDSWDLVKKNFNKKNHDYRFRTFGGLLWKMRQLSNI